MGRNKNIIPRKYLSWVLCLIGLPFLILYLADVSEHVFFVHHWTEEERSAQKHITDAMAYINSYLIFKNGVKKELVLKLIDSNASLFENIKIWEGGDNDALYFTYKNYKLLGFITNKNSYWVTYYRHIKIVQKFIKSGGNEIIYNGCKESDEYDRPEQGT